MGFEMAFRARKLSGTFVKRAPVLFSVSLFASDLDNFRIECLVTHNYYRARHGSPPLVLNGALTDEAQYWAERLLVTGASEDFDNSHIGICVAVLDKNNVSGIKVW